MGYLCANYGLPSLSVLHLGPMYATDVTLDVRQTDRRQKKSIA